MKGIILSIITGLFITLQTVFNTRASEKIGLWGTTAFIHGTGFILALLLLFFSGENQLKNLFETNKLYLIGGIFGVTIVYFSMKACSLLGPSFTIAIILIAQLITAAGIDHLGLFGITPKPLSFINYLGLAIMTAGIIIFKVK